PALVDRVGQRHPRAGPQRALAPSAPAYHELLFAVEPIQLLVIHRVPFTRQHPAQPSIPEAPPLRGQVAQSLSDRRIVRPLVLVAQRRTIQPYQPACVPLTQPVALHHPAHRLSLHRRPQTFFPSRSLSAALSNIDSASSFFRRRFSSSSDFRRRASDTSSPPYFAVHL